MTFDEWIESLESAIRRFETKHGWEPYGLPLADSTGLECWRDYWADGYTPEHAFAEDLSYANR